MKYCPNCGEKLIEGKQFCPSCGEKVPEVTKVNEDLEICKKAPKKQTKAFGIVALIGSILAMVCAHVGVIPVYNLVFLPLAIFFIALAMAFSLLHLIKHCPKKGIGTASMVLSVIAIHVEIVSAVLSVIGIALIGAMFLGFI